MGHFTLSKPRSKSGNIPYNLICTTTFNDSSIFDYDYFVGLYIYMHLSLETAYVGDVTIST